MDNQTLEEILEIFCPSGPYTVSVDGWTKAALQEKITELWSFPIDLNDYGEETGYVTEDLDTALMWFGWLATLIEAREDRHAPDYPVRIKPNALWPPIKEAYTALQEEVVDTVVKLKIHVKEAGPNDLTVTTIKQRLDDLFTTWRNTSEHNKHLGERASRMIREARQKAQKPNERLQIAQGNAEGLQREAVFALDTGIDRWIEVADHVGKHGTMPDFD